MISYTVIFVVVVVVVVVVITSTVDKQTIEVLPIAHLVVHDK